ncbi:MAG: hypothetical protein P1Q69_08740, partial [Candidatus Thorarchaeota archaeon]|nr:hypothetical protein [Candidatus Thorarchaeota archaeon]
MEKFKENQILDLILMHIVFAIPTALILIIFQDVAIGARLLIVVVLYNILLPVWAHLRDHKDWLEIWLFVLPLSILMVFPDWYLASQLQALSFPPDGFPMIGAVPFYMAGLWAIPLFLIVFTGLLFKEKGTPMTYLTIIIMSLLLFGGSEATLWMLGSWYAHDVFMIGNVALYIIIPELILGLSTYIGFLMVREK